MENDRKWDRRMFHQMYLFIEDSISAGDFDQVQQVQSAAIRGNRKLNIKLGEELPQQLSVILQLSFSISAVCEVMREATVNFAIQKGLMFNRVKEEEEMVSAHLEDSYDGP